MLCLITYKVRAENRYGFLRPGLKTGVGNGLFGSESGSGFGDVGGTPPPKIPRSTSPRHFCHPEILQFWKTISILYTKSYHVLNSTSSLAARSQFISNMFPSVRKALCK